MIFIILQYDLAAKKMVPRDESSCNLTITVSHDYDVMSKICFNRNRQCLPLL